MDVFDANGKLVRGYQRFSESYVSIRNRTIEARVRDEGGFRWPEARLALNPTFATGETVDDLIGRDLLHGECGWIFRDRKQDPARVPMDLYPHQVRAVEIASRGQSLLTTTGTGSGKSLTYNLPAVDHALKEHDRGNVRSIKTIAVYPMNALVNSQFDGLSRLLGDQAESPSRRHTAVRVERYTGQEGNEEHERILENPPDILLTNYVMLDLLLTRPDERDKLLAAAQGLRFLVLDELHTYRGRQGADVALLVRRLREACNAPYLQCIGTSATMASGRDEAALEQVATVATTLFGTRVTPDGVITESLERVTRPLTDADRVRLRDRIGQRPPDDYAAFTDDPLAVWVEHTFGVYEDPPGSDTLHRRDPITVSQAAGTLAADTGCREDECEDAIKATLMQGTRIDRPGTVPRSVFAFRLHQFLSKGDTVYISLEPEDARHITLRYQTTVKGHGDKWLYPLAFCRECGQEYLRVEQRPLHGQPCFLPRPEPRPGQVEPDADDDDEQERPEAGYLYVSAAEPWPDDEDEQLDRVPDSWLEETKTRIRLKRERVRLVPRTVQVRPDGYPAGEGEGVRAAFVPGPFTFCLAPDCGAAYETQGREFARIGGLSAEGRSSAVSILSTHLVHELGAAEATPKLLSFTDNRQDAALQAGHFNDLVQVALLRAGLHRAIQDAPEDGLADADVAQAVAGALGLTASEVAKRGEPVVTGTREDVEQALRHVIRYRVYVDLQRGWRFTMPDLEQTGLLRIAYTTLEEAARRDDLWADADPLLAKANPDQRERVCRVLLDQLRGGLAVGVDCLQSEPLEGFQRIARDRLDDAWQLPEGRQVRLGAVAWPRSRIPSDRPGRDLTLSGRTKFGQWLRKCAFRGKGLRVDRTEALIVSVLKTLASPAVGILEEVDQERRGTTGSGYRIIPRVLRWRKGDGQPVRDVVREELTESRIGRRRVRSGPNEYFKELYTTRAWEFRGSQSARRDDTGWRPSLRAAEHTAQVAVKDRKERERLFGESLLQVLYCSPTMELGVDIADLDAVLLRNVPPTPANYAQRSGRAGRAGKPALVVTYCATGNEHDQYFFKHAEKMISGRVTPPRLDLTNEDLVRAHVQAIWLAETGLDLETSLSDLLDTQNPTLALVADARRRVESEAALGSATRRARAAFAWDLPALERTSWYHDGWIGEQVKRAPDEFDRACWRWRTLYRTALEESRVQYEAMQRLNRRTAKDAYRDARRAWQRAEAQLGLLCVAGDPHDSDFYSYRYFAAEGFLPGYAFPRLPLTAFLDRGHAAPHAVLRPRFLALTEFGPQTLIYHEGDNYQVHRATVPLPADQSTPLFGEAKRCRRCGYLYKPSDDVCSRCDNADSLETIHGLMLMQAVNAFRRERITADEEERRRERFDIVTWFAFEDGRWQDAEVVGEREQVLARLTYGDTTLIRRSNQGKRGRKRDGPDGGDGYWINVKSGRWASQKEAGDAAPQEVRRVIPYVEDRRNALVYEPTGHPSLQVMTTLQAALKRAIAVTFDLEESELAAEPLPRLGDRRTILLYEAEEGGAGTLRRLVTEPGQLAGVARTALELLHFDRDGMDREVPGEPEPCGRACYDCLLSYSNQLDHREIDRMLVRDMLLDLAAAQVRLTDAAPDRSPAAVASGFARLRSEAAGSPAELLLCEMLESRGFPPPTYVHTPIKKVGVTPAFSYYDDRAQVAFLVEDEADGNETERRRRQQEDEALLDKHGWMSFVFRLAERDRWPDTLKVVAEALGVSENQEAPR